MAVYTQTSPSPPSCAGRFSFAVYEPCTKGCAAATQRNKVYQAWTFGDHGRLPGTPSTSLHSGASRRGNWNDLKAFSPAGCDCRWSRDNSTCPRKQVMGGLARMFYSTSCRPVQMTIRSLPSSVMMYRLCSSIRIFRCSWPDDWPSQVRLSQPGLFQTQLHNSLRDQVLPGTDQQDGQGPSDASDGHHITPGRENEVPTDHG